MEDFNRGIITGALAVGFWIYMRRKEGSHVEIFMEQTLQSSVQWSLRKSKCNKAIDGFGRRWFF